MLARDEFRHVQLSRPDAILHGISLGERDDFLLLHAGGEHAGVFKPVMKFLSEAGHGAAAFDLRGHGRSRNLTPIPLTRLADDAEDMIAAMNRPIVVGASLGGFVLMAALTRPARRVDVRALVLLDVIPHLDPERVDEYLRGAVGDGSKAPLVEHILSLTSDMRKVCDRLDMPVLLVRAGHDTPLTDASVHSFRTLVPHAEVIVIEDAAHLIAQTSPHALSEVLITLAARLGEYGE